MYTGNGQALGVVGLLIFSLALPVHAAFPTKQEVISTMGLVNDYWIEGHPDPGDNQWARATYFEGNMAMYTVYRDQRYYNYALFWAQSHNWELNGGDTTRIADDQCAGQTYLELYEYEPDPNKIQHIRSSIDHMVNSTKRDDWYWIDALQMAMPVFARLGTMYSNTDYYDKMWDLYSYTKYIRGANGLYSDNGTYNYGDYLWWRDDNYDPPVRSPNGKMIYWSRGNGWVIAAHARTLEYLPDADPHYDEYVQVLEDMAASLKDRQRTDGFWNSNLDDPDHCGGKETSGTAFFTYAIAWGINNGFLDDATYRPLVEKAWNGMVSSAVHPDGKLGYVQASALEPCGHYPFGYEDTTDFGVGAFLLAGSEVVKMADGLMPNPVVWYSSTDWTAVHDLGPGITGRRVVQFDITPSDSPTDGLVGYTNRDRAVGTWSDLALTVRMATNGRFEARNGGSYDAEVDVPYSAGTKYHVKIGVDLNEAVYDVWVASEGAGETKIAEDYVFRSDAPSMTDLGKTVLKTDPSYGVFKVENHTVESTCPNDYDYDNDVDGRNLADLIAGLVDGMKGIDALGAFAADFGQVGCR
jgi:unsaturated rhamnogalacturonyl hydrolase